MVSDSSLTPTMLDDQARVTDRQEIDSDALLQASRRVDWRFLLPDPNLGRVAYVGPARGALIESLRLFSASVTLVETSADVDATAQYDLVVAVGPSLEMLRRASELVGPAGFLYVEAYGRFQRRGADRRLRGPSDYISALRRLGLAEAELHWHWPNFESCAEIIPLNDSNALLLALARRSGPAARVKSALARALLRSGLFVRLVPYFSMLARRPGPLSEHLS